MQIFPISKGPKLTSRDSNYYHSMPEPFVEGQEEPYRLRIGIYSQTAKQHTGIASSVEHLDLSFDLFFVQQVNDSDSEVVEMIIPAEAEKLLLNDRLPRQVTLSGWLFDTNVEVDGEQEAGLTAWKIFYEQARISALAKTGRYVRADILGQSYYGALISSNVGMGAAEPNRVDLTISMLCGSVVPRRVDKSILELIPGTDVKGWLTAEGAAAVGLVNLTANPRANQLQTAVQALPKESVGALTFTSQPNSSLARRTIFIVPERTRFF